MRPYLLLALLALAAFLAIRAWRTGKVPVISLIAITVLAVPLAILEGNWISLQRTLGAATAEIADRPEANVHCQRATEAMFYAEAEAGKVAFMEDGSTSPTSFLTLSMCQNLRDWLASDKNNPTFDQVIAVHVLTHEAMHVAGHKSEPITECYAMQEDARMAVALGATPEQGKALAETYWEKVYPRMSESYRSPDCVSGGPMDRTPLDGQWP